MTSKEEFGKQVFMDKMSEIYDTAMKNNHFESILMMELNFILEKVKKEKLSPEVVNSTIRAIIESKTPEEVDKVYEEFMEISVKDMHPRMIVSTVYVNKCKKEGWDN